MGVTTSSVICASPMAEPSTVLVSTPLLVLPHLEFGAIASGTALNPVYLSSVASVSLSWVGNQWGIAGPRAGCGPAMAFLRLPTLHYHLHIQQPHARRAQLPHYPAVGMTLFILSSWWV